MSENFINPNNLKPKETLTGEERIPIYNKSKSIPIKYTTVDEISNQVRDDIQSAVANIPSNNVRFDLANPNSPGNTFTPDIQLDGDTLYVSSLNNSLWTSDGSGYQSSSLVIVPSTPFNFAGTTVDAGGNKLSAIERSGAVSLNGASNSDWQLNVINTGTTDAHGMVVGVGASSTGEPYRVVKGTTNLFRVQNDGTVNTKNYSLPLAAPTTGQVLGYSSAGVSDWVAGSAGGGGDLMWGLVVFVDPANYQGVGTEEIGNASKPWQTIQAAIDYAANYSAVTLGGAYPVQVYVRQGIYNGTVRLEHYAYIHYEAGVIFTSGTGHKDLVSTGKIVRVTGYACWEGYTANTMLSVVSDIKLHFEFDKAFCSHFGTFGYNSDTTIIGNSVYQVGSAGNVQPFRMYDNAKSRIFIREKFESEVYVLGFWISVTATNNVDLIFNCPQIITVPTLYRATFTAGAKTQFNLSFIGANFKVVVNGNLINEVNDASGSNLNAIIAHTNSTVASTTGKMTINGNIFGKYVPCAYAYFNSYYGNIEINGNVTTENNAVPIAFLAGTSSSDSRLLVRNGKVSGGKCSFGAGKKVYLQNVLIENTGVVADAEEVFTTGSYCTVYMYDSRIHAVGTNPQITAGGAGTGTVLGFSKVLTNAPLTTGVDTFLGLVAEAAPVIYPVI